MRIVFLAVLLHLTAFSGAFAQSWGTVTGRVTEQGTNAPIPYATVLVSQTNFGTAADGDGYYTLPLPFGHHVLRFSAVGYASLFDTLHVRPSSTLQWDAALAVLPVQMDSIVVEVAAAPLEAGVYRIDPEHLRALPTAFRDGFRIIKSMPGVTTNNELTNEYSVRGGSYNENLVFVNGYEVFKPFRTRKGEQEGLGIVNPDLAQRLTFYSGGFPARYGGKLSSALDVVYRRPERETITGNAYASLLDAGWPPVPRRSTTGWGGSLACDTCRPGTSSTHKICEATTALSSSMRRGRSPTGWPPATRSRRWASSCETSLRWIQRTGRRTSERRSTPS